MTPGELRAVVLAALVGLLVVALNIGCGDDVRWERVAECASGPAWHIGDELICDDHMQSTFAARDWRPGDNAETACAYCEGFIR